MKIHALIWDLAVRPDVSGACKCTRLTHYALAALNSSIHSLPTTCPGRHAYFAAFLKLVKIIPVEVHVHLTCRSFPCLAHTNITLIMQIIGRVRHSAVAYVISHVLYANTAPEFTCHVKSHSAPQILLHLKISRSRPGLIMLSCLICVSLPA